MLAPATQDALARAGSAIGSLATSSNPDARWAMTASYAALGAVAAATATGRLRAWLWPQRLEDAALESLDATDADETRKPLPALPKRLTRRPPIAWPTVALACVSVGTWAGAWVAYTQLKAPWYATLPVSTTAAYWGFTVLHDAVHGSVSPKYKLLNYAVGQLAGVPLLAPLALFRSIHLTHHRFTNDHDSGPNGSSLDPDEWAGRGPWFLLPLRWATVMVYYCHFFSWQSATRARNERTPPGALAADRRTTLEALSFGFALVCALAKLHERFGDAVVVCWLAPSLLAMTLLMAVFDYLVHRPHVVPFRVDPYKATHAVSAFGCVDHPAWNALWLSQNMHLLHHAFPWAPFTAYPEIWRAVGAEFLARGARAVPVLVWDAPAAFEELSDPDAFKKRA